MGLAGRGTICTVVGVAVGGVWAGMMVLRMIFEIPQS